jgi:K+-transporting ATPase c subunit
MPLFTSEYVFSDDYPTIEPSLKLDFTNARALDPRITFTRASTATYVGANGLIKTAGVDEPRFDHDPTTGESLGLLIEESRTNFFANSETFNGTATGDFFRGQEIYNKSVNINQFYFASDYASYNIQVGDVYTLTGFIRAGSQTGNILIRWIDGFNAPVASVNSFTYTPTAAGEFVTFTFTFTQAISSSINCAITGSSGDDADFAIMQLEKGSFPTSYIPTSGSTATRALEYGYTTNMNFYNQNEGSVVSEIKLLDYGSGVYGKVIWSLNQAGGFGEGIYYVNSNGSNDIDYNVQNSGSQFSGSSFTSNNFIKSAIGLKENSMINYFNGSLVGSEDTSGTIPNNIGRLVIGNNAWGSSDPSGGLNPGNCHIKSFSYYPKRLTNAQLQTLTQ